MMHSTNQMHVRLFRSGFLLFTIISFLFAGTAHATRYQHGILSTRTTDTVSGSYSSVQERKSGGSRLVDHHLRSLSPGIRVATFAQYYFTIETSPAVTVTAYDIEHLNQVMTTNEAEVTISSDASEAYPKVDLLFVSETKAYLLHPESAEILIINPLAEDAASFVTGRIDCSGFDPSDGIPDVTAGVVGESYVWITFACRHSGETVTESRLGVLDPETDTFITTGQETDGLAGIPLPVAEPFKVIFMEDPGLVLIGASGNITGNADYSGGIVQVDPGTFAAEQIWDDGEAFSSYYIGYLAGIAMVSMNDGFIICAFSESDQTLYHFNAETGETVEVSFNSTDAGYMKNKSFSGLSGGMGLDQHDRLWICNRTDQNLLIMNTTPNATGSYRSDELISIPDNGGQGAVPLQICFCMEPEATDEDEEAKPSSSGESGNFCFINALLNP